MYSIRTSSVTLPLLATMPLGYQVHHILRGRIIVCARWLHGIRLKRALPTILQAPCGECAVRLMKNDFIDDDAFTAKFDDKSLQLDDPKSPSVLGCKTVGRLVVWLQHKLPFCIQRHGVGRRAGLENTGATRAESRV